MCRGVSAGSADRLDALVWAITELLPSTKAIPGDVNWGAANDELVAGSGWRMEGDEGTGWEMPNERRR